MTNWKAVAVSLGLAVGWIMGSPAIALGPPPSIPDPQAEVQMKVARVEALTQHLRIYPRDVDEMEHLAALYVANGSYDAAIGPLARALQLDPYRRSLWIALHAALRHLDRQKISDEELTLRAAEFRNALTP
jgi:cytochrome c-type biogenesis protein CcmH/NrfG